MPFGADVPTPQLRGEAGPPPADSELLDHQASEFMGTFFDHLNADNNMRAWFDEGLGGIFTNQWLMAPPPEVVAHQVTLGFLDSLQPVSNSLAGLSDAAVRSSLPPVPPSNTKARPLAEEVQFGSDPNFNREKFVPPSESETSQAMSAQQIATLGCLQRISEGGSVAGNSEQTVPSPIGPRGGESVATSPHPAPAAPPSKPTPPPRKRKKPGAEAEAAATGAGDGTKKRRQSPRQTLTGEQRRQNHVRSEQNRRDLAKDYYTELLEIVPGLKDRGYTRAVALSKVAQFLIEFTAENRMLKERLSRTTAANGTP
ncbi:e6ab85d5-66dc-48c7-9bfa-0f9f7438cb87 [Thermothielavioides terrestris]|uniref:E6ab85d5-66dc-48c7-9bfa-0f9f7438cb87 n=1 Tax=Thermothielavioides terrestris TaxID=2587410 RepID=A0A446BYW6_9PEZI|nr:e6ab85d5-66dc-48c7-9bfa-0f9f7438cb87 [Thermothielavioides terrestris]